MKRLLADYDGFIAAVVEILEAAPNLVHVSFVHVLVYVSRSPKSSPIFLPSPVQCRAYLFPALLQSPP